MASAAKAKTKEELEEMEQSASKKAASLQDRERIVTSAGFDANVSEGARIILSEDGKSFSTGPDPGDSYTYNEETGDWRNFGASSGIKNISLSEIARPASGGGGGEAPRPIPTSGVVGDVGAVATPGVTTEQVLGTQNYNSMNNFQPISQTMGNNGQTQHLNPLVAAQNWVHELQPQPTYNLGQYQNPQIGLLEDEQQNSIWGPPSMQYAAGYTGPITNGFGGVMV